MPGMYSSDELDNLHSEAQEDSLSYADVYGETLEESLTNYMPWQAEQDAMDYEFNARYDYVSEAFGDEARILRDQAVYEEYLDAIERGCEDDFKTWKVKQNERIIAASKARWEYDIDDDIPF